MLVKVIAHAAGGNQAISLRCPACRQIGVFGSLNGVADLDLGSMQLGQRRCPNVDCSCHVFCIYDKNRRVLRSYPPELIDFDPKNIPSAIAKSFSEAIACRSENLYVASAIMIRRTLEELCEDKAATGQSLKARVTSLQESVVLPRSLLDALDDLRLLGNDAAHIEAKTYDAIGSEELDVAIELTKEILKSVYQLDDLLAKLRALRK